MQGLLEEILLLQTEWSDSNTSSMQRRGELVRHAVPAWLEGRIGTIGADVPPEVDDLAVQGRDGTGRKTELPWARLFSRSRSPSATEGWYVVYLFSALGDRVYLSLNQGTTVWDNGEFRPRPPAVLQQRVAWARDLLAARLAARPDLHATISLDARGTRLGAGYELGNVAAIEYRLDSIPPPDALEGDARFLVGALGDLYLAEETSVSVPGEPPPEVADALTAVEAAAGRRPRRQRYRLTVAERRAIERRAVDAAIALLSGEGYVVRDVGATRSYDLDARKGDEHLFVEVKGTTSAGEEVVLTSREVELHGKEHPWNMLAVVHGIHLDRSADPPVASGGTLLVIRPWQIQTDALHPIAYRYSVPSDGVGTEGSSLAASLADSGDADGTRRDNGAGTPVTQ